jgi:inhibitor of cysteine peptidase
MSNFVRIQFCIITMVLLTQWLVACSSDSKPTTLSPSVESPPTAAKATEATNEAQVKNIVIRLLESFPVQANVVVRGELPDSCTTLDQFLQDRNGNTFMLKILTAQQANKVCTKAIEPFEQVIPLDMEGLKAGVYTVNVNGVTESFELGMDNTIRR